MFDRYESLLQYWRVGFGLPLRIVNSRRAVRQIASPLPMQRPDESKRTQILERAASLFAAKPYHEVRLEDIAAESRIGKGTIYVYFASKEDLYRTLVSEGLARVVEAVRGELTDERRDVWLRLSGIARELLTFGLRFPDLFRVMRDGSVLPDDGLASLRRQLGELVAETIRRGNAHGECDDPHPELSAQYFVSFVRSALLWAPASIDAATLQEHLMRLFRRGIAPRGCER